VHIKLELMIHHVLASSPTIQYNYLVARWLTFHQPYNIGDRFAICTMNNHGAVKVRE